MTPQAVAVGIAQGLKKKEKAPQTLERTVCGAKTGEKCGLEMLTLLNCTLFWRGDGGNLEIEEGYRVTRHCGAALPRVSGQQRVWRRPAIQ